MCVKRGTLEAGLRARLRTFNELRVIKWQLGWEQRPYWPAPADPQEQAQLGEATVAVPGILPLHSPAAFVHHFNAASPFFVYCKQTWKCSLKVKVDLNRIITIIRVSRSARLPVCAASSTRFEYFCRRLTGGSSHLHWQSFLLLLRENNLGQNVPGRSWF